MRGEMYVDIPPGAHADASFVALTNAGEFRHVGTQFAIAVVDGATRLRVREGRVQWHAADGESTVPAGTEVLIDRDHKRDAHGSRECRARTGRGPKPWRRRSTSRTGRSRISSNGWRARPAASWISPMNARVVQVGTIRTHGNVRGSPPMQALDAVMASTSLRFELPAGVIRVSFAGESPLSEPRT